MDAGHLVSGGKFEPQRSGHFELEFDGFPGGDTLKLMVKSAFTPSESNEVMSMPYMNTFSKYPGMVTIEEGEIVIRDFVDQDSFDKVIQWRKSVYDPETGAIKSNDQYKKNGYLLLVSSDGSIERKFKLINAWPSAIGSVALEHGSAEEIGIPVTIAFDKFIKEA